MSLPMRLIVFLVLFGLALGCNRATKERVSKEDLEGLINDDNQKATAEDDEDETAEDASEEWEDFDLMCDHFERPNRTQKLPDIIIIGAKKGGTRALLEFLRLHPLIKAAGREVHFFDNHFHEGVDWYRGRMPLVAEGQLTVEKTPGYFHTPKAPERLKSVVPNAKLLLILRNPVKRMISDYNQFRTKNLGLGRDYPTFEEFAFKQLDGSIRIEYPPLQRSIYHVHMKRWYKHFPEDQIFVINGDDFIREPWSEISKVEQFLEIEPKVEERNFFFNETKGFYCGRDIRSSGVWECKRDKCLSKSKGRKSPPVKQESKDRLTEFFAPHNAIFYELIKKNFGWPSYADED